MWSSEYRLLTLETSFGKYRSNSLVHTTLVEERTKESIPMMRNILDYFETMTWPEKKGYGYRKNIGSGQRKAFVMGKTHRYDLPYELHESQYNRKHPKLHEMLCNLMEDHNPSFEFNAIQLNCNVQCEPHFDKNNEGLSYCLAIGDFEGGGLTVFEPEKNVIDNKNRWVKYDGANLLHSSAPVTSGKRYVMVFYTRVPKRKKM